MSLTIRLAAASPISRVMDLTIQDDAAPEALILRYRLHSDLFVRAWLLRSATDAAPRYRYVGDSSRTCPGAFDSRVERLIHRALDLTDLLAPDSRRETTRPLSTRNGPKRFSPDIAGDRFASLKRSKVAA